MKRLDEIDTKNFIELMQLPKDAAHWSRYVHYYHKITGKNPTSGCGKCKLNATYRTLWLYYKSLN